MPIDSLDIYIEKNVLRSTKSNYDMTFCDTVITSQSTKIVTQKLMFLCNSMFGFRNSRVVQSYMEI